MKKVLVTLGIILSVSFILLAFVVPVNHSSLVLKHQNRALLADGNPGPPTPPPPPPPTQNITLDGLQTLPSTQPDVLLIADGNPGPPTPPPPPPPTQNIMLEGIAAVQLS